MLKVVTKIQSPRAKKNPSCTIKLKTGTCVNIHTINFKRMLEDQRYVTKYRPIENERENVYSKFLLMKSSKKYSIFSCACYLIIWLMISPKSLKKKGVLKIWQLVFLRGVKTHFGKLPLKWCIFIHEKKKIFCNIAL